MHRNFGLCPKSYAEFFSDEPYGIRFMAEPIECRSNYWLNAILLPDKDARQKFLQFSNDNGVMTRPVWELMSRLRMFNSAQHDGLKNSQWLADRIVNIPSGVLL